MDRYNPMNHIDDIIMAPFIQYYLFKISNSRVVQSVYNLSHRIDDFTDITGMFFIRLSILNKLLLYKTLNRLFYSNLSD
jgi:hypothetical protein